MATPMAQDPLDATSPLPEPTPEQQIEILTQNLTEAQKELDDREAFIKEMQNEDNRIAAILKAIMEAQQSRKEQKISRKSFTFATFDGRKDGKIVLSWLSRFDDYFSGESFSKKEKIKCAMNYLIDKASLWWNVMRKSTTPPTTWTSFQDVFKKTFLPAQFHLDARRTWSKLMWQEGEDVYKYTERFWQSLLNLRMLEEVPEDTLQRKFEDGLESGIQAKLNTLKPASLYEAISFAHDAEKEFKSITRSLQARPSQMVRPQQTPMVRNFNFRKRFSSSSQPTLTSATPPPNHDNIVPKSQSANVSVQNKKAKVVCWRCGKIGHTKAFCRVKLPQQKTPSAQLHDIDVAPNVQAPTWTEDSLEQGMPFSIHDLLKMEV